jgi:hypothetical protein
MCTTKRKGEQGQAVVEMLAFTPLFVLLLLMLVQTFLANRALFRSITTAEALLFDQASHHNCPNATPSCTYNSDSTGRLVWTPARMPEVTIPLLRPFRAAADGTGIRLWSNSPLNRRAGCAAGADCMKTSDACSGRPCKTTKMGVGTYRSLDEVFDMAGMWPDPLAWLILKRW